MKSIEEINHLENCECDVICPNCTEKHKPNQEETIKLQAKDLTGEHIANKAIKNAVNPDHYNRFAITPIEYIEANKLDFAVGNVVKYVSRYDAKDGLKDLLKAKEYLDIVIARYK